MMSDGLLPTPEYYNSLLSGSTGRARSVVAFLGSVDRLVARNRLGCLSLRMISWKTRNL